MSTARVIPAAALSRPAAFYSLTKPDVSFLVVLTTLGGYALGSRGPMDWTRMAHTVFGTLLVAAGTSALNQYIERDRDALMRRTAGRALPTGVLRPAEALAFGGTLLAIGGLYLVFATNVLATLCALAASASYLTIYTPLKSRSTWATLIGGFPGAAPPLVGWAAARGSLDRDAWILFAIAFLWQIPHFHSIAWIYREDYARAGIRVLPVVDREGRRTFRQILLAAAVLIPISLLPAVTGLANVRYFFGAGVVGLLLVALCYWAAAEKTNTRAKWLMHVTVLQLPLLLALLWWDKIPR
jgi:protoheme IX farnesyltransferase